MRPPNHVVLLAATNLAWMVITPPSLAANRTRQYDFEDGAPGQSTTTVTDSIDTVFYEPVPNNPGFAWIEVPGNAPRPLPTGGMMDSVDSVIRVTPPLNAVSGSGVYVDVSAGSGLELPSANRTPSKIALRFDGNTSFDDFESDEGATGTGYAGIRGVFIIDDAYNNNDDVAGGTKAFENFSLFSQAWVYPDSSARNTLQTVFQIGTQHGTVHDQRGQSVGGSRPSRRRSAAHGH